MISFRGKEIVFGDDGYKAAIGYVPESCALYENLTGREYLEFIGHLHHLEPTEISSKVKRLLDLVGIDRSADNLIREYSKGMKQKILIISALMHDPDLIILDEPFSGLDANTVSVFKEILRESAKHGKAVIFCSHVLEVVERLVDRLMIIKQGKELATGTPDEIIAQTGHQALDRAFNELTGSGDIDSQAQQIVEIISHPNRQNRKEDG